MGNPEPEPEVCRLEPETRAVCDKIARGNDVCGDCVTSACGACRQIFVKWCERPKPVASIEECLRERGDLCARQGDQPHRDRCYAGLRNACARWLCAALRRRKKCSARLSSASPKSRLLRCALKASA